MAALFRIFGTMCRDFNVAGRLGAVIIGICVLFAGYMKARQDMPGWLRWLAWFNPFYWAFASVMINGERERGRAGNRFSMAGRRG